MFGDAVGKECEEQQVNVWLAPAVNLHGIRCAEEILNIFLKTRT